MFRQPTTFQQYYRVQPISAIKSPDNEVLWGGKIVLPQSALQKLTVMHVSFPMLFELKSNDTQRITHSGVLEFVAPEGRAYVPEWMLTSLGIKAGQLVQITNVSLELGSFIKIQPQSVDFLDISDPKAVLERSLRNFSALTVDDTFEIKYNDQKYQIKVLEAKPETDRRAVCVVETDLEVDFAPPVGYVEPSMTPPTGGPIGSGKAPSQVPKDGGMAKAINFEAQASKPQGSRLNGKDVEQQTTDIYSDLDAPALDLAPGQLFFGYPVVPLEKEEPSQEKWTGGSSLRS